ncbi:MAG TPA: hypothetical protein VL992_01735 [Tepidisphaeraceae bacterium]|nr:hypothetical protein [Tepidisphaeraceae bacterium]
MEAALIERDREKIREATPTPQPPGRYSPNFNVAFPKGFLPGGTPPDYVPPSQLQSLKDEAYNRWQYYSNLLSGIKLVTPRDQVKIAALQAQMNQWMQAFETVDALITSEKQPAQELAEFLAQHRGKVAYGPNPADVGTIGPDGSGSFSGYDSYTISRPLGDTILDAGGAAFNGTSGPATPPLDTDVDDDSGYTKPSPRKNPGGAADPDKVTNEAGDAAGEAAPGALTSTADAVNDIKNGGVAIVKTWSFGEQYGVMVVSPTGAVLTPNQGRNILERWAGVPEQDLPPDPMDQPK